MDFMGDTLHLELPTAGKVLSYRLCKRGDDFMGNKDFRYCLKQIKALAVWL
jgi:hypothetical protein